jgi:hypothetical protein
MVTKAVKAKEKEPGKPSYDNWRILSRLHSEIGIASRTEGVHMHELAARAWAAYKEARSRTVSVTATHVESSVTNSTDPSITPRTVTERRIIAVVLQFLRDAETIEMRPILTALLDWCADRPSATRKPAQNTNEKDLSK